MKSKVFIISLLLPLLVWSHQDPSISCRFALSNNLTHIILDDINEQNSQILFNGTLYDKQLELSKNNPHRARRLDKYLANLNFESFLVQNNHDKIAEDILSIIYGDKFSLINKWSTPNELFKDSKQKTILREFILKKGLIEIFNEIGYQSPSFLSRLRVRIHNLIHKSGILWILARFSLSTFSYREVPTQLTENLVLYGWEKNKVEIENYFNQQKKRDLFNNWHNELGLILGGVLAITGYFNYYDQVSEQIVSMQSSTVSQYNNSRQILDEQREAIKSQYEIEQSLIKEIESKQKSADGTVVQLTKEEQQHIRVLISGMDESNEP